MTDMGRADERALEEQRDGEDDDNRVEDERECNRELTRELHFPD